MDNSIFTKRFQYLYVCSRALFALLVLVAAAYFGDILSFFADSGEVSASKESIIKVISLFKVYYGISFLAVLFLFYLSYYIIVEIVFKNVKVRLISIAFLSIIAFLFYNDTYKDIIPAYVVLFFVINYVIYKIYNYDFAVLFDKSKYAQKVFVTFLVLCPFFSELLFPSAAIYLFRNAKLKVLTIFQKPLWEKLSILVAMALWANVLMFAFVSLSGLEAKKMPAGVKQIVKGNFYTMQIDAKTQRLFTCNAYKNFLYIFDLNNLNKEPQVLSIATGELENIQLNTEKREFYHFNRDDNTLLTYGMDDLRLRKQKRYHSMGGGSARVVFDNKSRIIAVTRENSGICFFDMNNLQLINYVVANEIADVLFDENSNSYILSFYKNNEYIKVISTDVSHVLNIPVPKFQQEVAISKKRNELYIALPLRSSIYVYDTNNFIFKRKISTIFGVRGLACDDKNDLLLAVSMFSGHVDIINLNKGNRISKKYVGDYLRKICLNIEKREAFVSSLFGGVYNFTY